MSIQEIKIRIHHLVDEEQDETILAEVRRMLSGEVELNQLDDLTDEQLIGIEKAREEVQRGHYNSLEEHKQLFREKTVKLEKYELTSIIASVMK